jgi:flagellar biosynthetic protein FliO
MPLIINQITFVMIIWFCSIKVAAEAITIVSPTKNISPFTNWPIVLIVLLGMIGFILALSWFVKRFGGLNFTGNREMRIVTSISLGARERVALIDIKGKQFLLGVTTQQISHLHSFDEAVIPLDDIKSKIKQNDFVTKLQSVLNSTKTNDVLDNAASANNNATSANNNKAKDSNTNAP